jgi:hypothetical protein
MNRVIVVLIAIISISGVSLLVAKPENEAKKPAEQWLALIDSGKFAESWKAADHYMQRVASEDLWQRKLDMMRKPLGEVLSRKLESAKLEHPNQWITVDHVRLKFATSFSNKKEAVETVTLMAQKGGSWKVAGYYIE